MSGTVVRRQRGWFAFPSFGDWEIPLPWGWQVIAHRQPAEFKRRWGWEMSREVGSWELDVWAGSFRLEASLPFRRSTI